MTTLSTRLASTLAAALGATSLLAACGDNVERIRPDANPVYDGAPADASPEATRSATIAIQQVNVFASVAAAGGPSYALGGGSISIDFSDLTGTEVAPVYGDGSIGTCTVYKYTKGTTAPAPSVDEGAITVGGDGFLRSIPGPCQFNATAGDYLCVAGAGSDVDGQHSATAGNGTTSVTLSGATFDLAGQGQVGMYLQVTGGNLGGAYPILAVTDTDTLLIAGAAVAAGTITSGSYALLQGAGPIPGGNPQYLSDGTGGATDVVTVQMDASSAFPGGIDVALEPIADGFALATDADLPNAFPSTARDVTFTCEGAGGNCGSDPATGDLKAFIITGSTTSGSVAGLPPFVMPAVPNGNEYTTFTCSFLAPSDDGGTIPSAAVEAILDTTPAPTRIETRVIRANGSTQFVGPGAANQLNVLVGRALVGHTTF